MMKRTRTGIKTSDRKIVTASSRASTIRGVFSRFWLTAIAGAIFVFIVFLHDAPDTAITTKSSKSNVEQDNKSMKVPDGHHHDGDTDATAMKMTMTQPPSQSPTIRQSSSPKKGIHKSETQHNPYHLSLSPSPIKRESLKQSTAVYEPPLQFFSDEPPRYQASTRDKKNASNSSVKDDLPRSNCVIFSCSASNYSLVDVQWNVTTTAICDRYHFYGTTFRVFKEGEHTPFEDPDVEDLIDANGRFPIAPNWCRVALLDDPNSTLAMYDTILYADVDVVFDEIAMVQLAQLAKDRSRKRGSRSEGWKWLITAKTEPRSNELVLRDSTFILPHLEEARPLIRRWAENWRYNCGSGGKRQHGGFRDQRVFNGLYTCGNKVHEIAESQRTPLQRRSEGVHCWDLYSQNLLFGEIAHCGSWLLTFENRTDCLSDYDAHPFVFEPSSDHPPLFQAPSADETGSGSTKAGQNCVVFSCSAPDDTSINPLHVDIHWNASKTRQCHRYHFFGKTVTSNRKDPVSPNWCHVALLDDPESALATFRTTIFVRVGVVFNESAMIRNVQEANKNLDASVDLVGYDDEQQWKWLITSKDNEDIVDDEQNKTLLLTSSFVLPNLEAARPMVKAWAHKYNMSTGEAEQQDEQTALNKLYFCGNEDEVKRMHFAGRSGSVHCWNASNETEQVLFGMIRSCQHRRSNMELYRQCMLMEQQDEELA